MSIFKRDDEETEVQGGGGGGPAKGAQLSERDSRHLKHLRGPQTPAQYRAETRKCAVEGGGCGGSHALPRVPLPTALWPDLAPGFFPRAAARQRARGRSSGAGRESRRGRRVPGLGNASCCRMGPVPRTLELFYDVLSPYSWLGFEVTPGAPLAGAWRAREGGERGAGAVVS